MSALDVKIVGQWRGVAGRSNLEAMLLGIGLAAWLLIVYVLSAGPATYMMNRGVSGKAFGFLELMYRPAGFFAKSSKLYLAYMSWFGGKGTDALLARKGVQHLSSPPSGGITQALRWVQVGMPASDAQRLMEQHGFSCSVVTNGTLGSLAGKDYVCCDRHEGWQTVLLLVEGKVSAVKVTAERIAP